MPASTSPLPACPVRRAVLGASAVGAAALLAGCAGPLEDSESGAVPEATGRGTVAVPAADLAVGDTLSVEVDGTTYLLHRPAADQVLAYGTVCPHAGCEVQPGDGDFQCPCHGSHFRLDDGAAYAGPAREPLPRFAAAVEGESIVLFV
jgi:cytochrome b6-f complex iron-sulfur subunit